MKKSTSLLAGVAGAILASGAAYGQTSVLWLVTEGHAGVERNEALIDWINTEQPGVYSIDKSMDIDNTLTTDTGTSISPSQMDLLNSYDLIVMGRYGVGGSSNMASTDWNDVTTPLLLMNPFMTRSNRWDWVGGAGDANLDIQDMVIVDSTSPVFDGVDTSGGVVQAHSEPLSTMVATVESSNLTGHTVAWTDLVDAEDNNLEYPWITLWDGTEESFSVGGTEGPAGRRTLFLQYIGMGVDDWTADGQQIFLNSMAATVPEPSTVALWIGFGALGCTLLVRRLRRKT